MLHKTLQNTNIIYYYTILYLKNQYLFFREFTPIIPPIELQIKIIINLEKVLKVTTFFANITPIRKIRQKMKTPLAIPMKNPFFLLRLDEINPPKYAPIQRARLDITDTRISGASSFVIKTENEIKHRIIIIIPIKEELIVQYNFELLKSLVDLFNNLIPPK